MALFMSGKIEVICGPMFSGKTEELIRRIRRAQIARQRVQIFKPNIDVRYHETSVVSHSALSVEAIAISYPVEILKHLSEATRVVAIDEIQFFDGDIIQVVEKLARRGCRVIVAGLDQDYRGRPFGPMPELLAMAEEVNKMHAICTVCGMPASKTFRRNSEVSDQVLVGEHDLYDARCRSHFEYPEEDNLLAYTLQNISLFGRPKSAESET